MSKEAYTSVTNCSLVVVGLWVSDAGMVVVCTISAFALAVPSQVILFYIYLCTVYVVYIYACTVPVAYIYLHTVCCLCLSVYILRCVYLSMLSISFPISI